MNSVYNCAVLTSYQLHTFALAVMCRHRETSVSEAQLIDLTVPLSTTAKIDFDWGGCCATVSVECNARLLCSHHAFGYFVNIVAGNLANY